MKRLLIMPTAFALASCGAIDDPIEDEGAQEEQPSRDEGSVSRALAEESDWAWPLTADEGTLSCDNEAVVFTDPEDNEWAVNGQAATMGYQEIDPIWAENPELDGLKVDIGPLIDLGLDLCD